jgi:hypothetical protein
LRPNTGIEKAGKKDEAMSNVFVYAIKRGGI